MTPAAQQMLYTIQKALRNTAEREINDIIANCASALAVRLEGVSSTFGMNLQELTSVDRQLIQYALAKHKA
jgi:hypothetical protein